MKMRYSGLAVTEIISICGAGQNVPIRRHNKRESRETGLTKEKCRGVAITRRKRLVLTHIYVVEVGGVQH
jgi:hypothetical protein